MKLIMRFMAFASILLMTGCDSLTQGFDVYFWTSTRDEQCHIFIDGDDKGPLPYLTEAPGCDDPVSKKQALHIALPSGGYDIELKNSKGDILYTELLKIRRSAGSSTISSTTDIRGTGARGNNVGGCLVREIYF